MTVVSVVIAASVVVVASFDEGEGQRSFGVTGDVLEAEVVIMCKGCHKNDQLPL